jgi:hypothetical protein
MGSVQRMSSMNLRKITETDRPQIVDSSARNPWHDGQGSADFFFEPHTDSFILEDDNGPVLNVRLARALRVNIVFNDPDARERNKETMTHLANFLRTMAGESGFREVVYTSENRALRAFGQTLGFSPTPDMVMSVDPGKG